MDVLTEAEKNIIQAVLCGHISDKQLARHLHVCQQTARNHLCNIYEKLDVHDRTMLCLYVIRAGWFDAWGRQSITPSQAQHIDERISINLQGINS